METKMKAWFIWIDDDWGDYVHGETINQAKSMFWRVWSQEAGEWINMRPVRVPRLDDVPITSKSIGWLGEDFEDQGEWTPICRCELCRDKSSVKENK